MDTKPLTLETGVSFEDVKETLEELWKLTVVDKMIVKWWGFHNEKTYMTEVTDDNWAEIAQSLNERGGNDTLEFTVPEVIEGHEVENDVSA